MQLNGMDNLMAQGGLLLDDPDSKTTSSRLDVVYARALNTGVFQRDELFGGFTKMRALTYSASIPMVMALLRDYEYEKFECIFGHGGIIGAEPEKLLRFQRVMDEKLNDGFVSIAGLDPERQKILYDRVAEGTARFHVVKDVIAHAKIYLLEDGERRRVVVGSANLSETAFSGRQAETLVVYDDDPIAWEHFDNQYQAVLETATTEVPIREKTIAADLLPIDETPLFKNVRESGSDTTIYVPAPTDQEAKYGTPSVLVDIDKIPTVERAALSDFQRDRNGNADHITITPTRVRQVGRMPVARAEDEQENVQLPSLSYNHGEFVHMDTTLDLRTDPADVKSDAALLTEFFNNYRGDFVGDVKRLQTDYFTFMSWFYFSPFLCGLRNRSLRQGNFNFSQPMFAILYGQSNCGKSSLVDTLMISMFGYGKKSFVPNNAFTPGRVRGLRQEFRRHPMIFDDVSTNRFRQYSEEVVKDGEISHGAEYPCITLLMNRDTKRFKEEIVKRSLMIYTRTSLPGNNPEAHERLQASVSRIQNDLTTSFYREYLRRMSERIEAEPGSGEGDMDVLNLSSSLLCRLFAENTPEGQTLPEWCAPMTLGNYQSRAYERSERILKGLLSRDRYTRDSHPSVGQWTVSGDNLLIGVDARSLREMRDEVPNWIMDDAASVSDQIVLDRKLTEDFIGESINRRRLSIFGFLGR